MIQIPTRQLWRAARIHEWKEDYKREKFWPGVQRLVRQAMCRLSGSPVTPTEGRRTRTAWEESNDRPASKLKQLALPTALEEEDKDAKEWAQWKRS